MMKDDFLWVEKYRPHKIEDCILPESLKNWGLIGNLKKAYDRSVKGYVFVSDTNSKL